MKSIHEQSIRRAIGPKIRWNNLGTNWQWWNSIKIFITETYWLWVLWPSFFPRIQLVSRLCKSGLLHRLCLNQIKMFMPSWYNCKFTSYLPWLVPEWMILVALSNTFHEKGWNFYRCIVFNTTALLRAGRLYWGVQKCSRIKKDTSVGSAILKRALVPLFSQSSAYFLQFEALSKAS